MIKSNLGDMRPRREKFKKEITLVSGGYVNRTAFPLGKITVYPWDSGMSEWMDEQQKITQPNERGLLLYRSVARVCNLNGCPVDDFVVGDVHTVLLQARSIETDSFLEYMPTCPMCAATEMCKIKVPDEFRPVGLKGQDYPGYDLITLPDSKDVVALRPLQIKDEMAIEGRTKENKERVPERIARMLTCIKTLNGEAVEGAVPLDAIFEWHQAISPKDLAHLELMQDELTPHLSLDLPQQCDLCSHKYLHSVQMGPDFFLPGRFAKSRTAMEAAI
jgi:hypothetical protein